MFHWRYVKITHTGLVVAFAWLLGSCGTTTASQLAKIPPSTATGSSSAEYPAAMRGTWMLGTEPCYLPVSPDADGRFVIEADVISGYEASYKPVRVAPELNKPHVWHITSVETYLGSQVTEMEHTFILSGGRLIEREGESTSVYVKCMEKHGKTHD